MQRPDFVAHISEWYLPSNIVVSVAGNVTHSRVVELATPLFEGMTDGALPEVEPYEPGVTRRTCARR